MNTKLLLDEMVNRFLCWRLPQDFAPDAGISFTHYTDPTWTHDNWPIGTNLFNDPQARAMLAHVCAPLIAALEAQAASLGTVGDATAGGFDQVANLLRERTFTQRDPDDYLPPDAIGPYGTHCNGTQFYHSKLDRDAANAIDMLSVALASQIEITNTERSHAERATSKLAALAQPGMVSVPVEPTESMIRAALDCQEADPEDGPESEMYYAYRAMIAAAQGESHE